MAPTILVVDDDPYTRQLIRRIVQRDFDVRLLEAAHGVAALELLLNEPVDIILMDVSMPVMGGLETLQVIRRAPEFASLPVMILAGKAEEQQVMQLVQLGIAGFLVKPFVPTLLSDRVARLLAQRMQERSQPTHRPRLRLALHRRSRVMVVDRATEFCEFFAAQLAPLCDVEAASSLPAALSRCIDSPPDVVFVGAVDRLIETEIFVRKVRDAHPDRRVPVVAFAAADEVQERAAMFDAVIVRSYLPEALRAGLRSVLTESATARWLLVPDGHYVGAFRERAQAHVEQALGTDLTAERVRPGWSFERVPWVVSALEFHVGELSWDLRLQMPYGEALRLASSASRLSAEQTSQEGVHMAIGMLAEDLGVILRSLAADEALDASCAEPRVSMAPSYVARESPDPASSSHWWLSCARGATGAALGLVQMSGVPRGRPLTAA